MRHLRHYRRLGRTMEHRRAMRRNMVQSLFEHGEIQTTLEKAKDLRPLAEKLITLAKAAQTGSKNAIRRIEIVMGERYFIEPKNISDYENMSLAQRREVMKNRNGRYHRTGQPQGAIPFTSRAITLKLIEDVAPRFVDRKGGYTRIIRLAKVRKGDNGALAILQLVGNEDVPANVPKPGKSDRRRKTDARYAAVKKAVKERKPSTAE